jgi:hypothetical protein
MLYIRLLILLVFISGMSYAAITVYYSRSKPVLTPASFPTIQVEKKITELQTQIRERSSSTASDELGPGATVEEEESEPVGGGMVAEVKLPGFSVSLPETSSWMTVAKMISLVLLTYLGVKMINLTFKKLEQSMLKRRARRA